MAKGDEKEKYDDSAFIFFVLSVVTIALIPTTISYIRKWRAAFKDPEEVKGNCNCDACRSKAKKMLLEKRKSKGASTWIKFILYCLLWVLFFFLTYTAYTKQSEAVVIFNPYDILGLYEGASADDIKANYRKLSLKWHPDKNKSPEATEMYTNINKAYKTLTDPETREKWEKYGNPDGPQGFSMGIALPSLLVDAKNSGLILGIYILFLVVVFPTIAICFWNSQKETSPNQLNKKTMGHYYQSVKQTHRFKHLIEILALSFEYVTLIPVRRSDENDIAKLKSLIPSTDDKKKSKKENIHPLSIKNPFLFFVHFSRLGDQLSPTMKEDLNTLIGLAHRHIFGLLELSVARQMLVPTTEAIVIAQMITQAVWSDTTHLTKGTELLQIPYLTQASIAKLSSPKWKMNFQQFIKASPEKRREYFEKEENFNQQQIDDIERVIRNFPSDLSVELKIEVEDEEIVTAGSFATLVAKFSRPSQGESSEKQKSEPVEVHAPYYPAPKTEAWWVLMGDEKSGTVLGLTKVPAMRDGAEVKIQFPTPRKPGQFPFTVFIMNDSYVGFDLKVPYKLVVAKEVIPKKVEAIEEEEENEGDAGSGKEDEVSDQSASDEDSENDDE